MGNKNILKDIIKITDNREQKIIIGRQLFDCNREEYIERRVSDMKADLKRIFPDDSSEDLEEKFYLSIYDYWVYGNNLREEFFYGFDKKTDIEKRNYLTFRNRFEIYKILNNQEDEAIFRDKYKTYMYFREFYRRDVIFISDENDLPVFLEFIEKHPVFFVKPGDVGLGLGVYKEDVSRWNNKKELFDNLLYKVCEEASNISWSKTKGIVLEEPIVQEASFSELHPWSVNMVRLTTILIDDRVEILDAWGRFGINGNEIAAAAMGEIYCGINVETGVIETDGFTEFSDVYSEHPSTGIQFKGYEIHRWKECIELGKKLAKMMPSVRYVGWDLTLTEKGWCIIEGNERGEFLGQLIYNKPYKELLQTIIGTKLADGFWWE